MIKFRPLKSKEKTFRGVIKQIAEAYNIPVIYQNELHKYSVEGASCDGVYLPDCRLIMLLESGDDFEIAKTFCHEIAHYILELFDMDSPDTDEDEARTCDLAYDVWEQYFRHFEVLDPMDFQFER